MRRCGRAHLFSSAKHRGQELWTAPLWRRCQQKSRSWVDGNWKRAVGEWDLDLSIFGCRINLLSLTLRTRPGRQNGTSAFARTFMWCSTAIIRLFDRTNRVAHQYYISNWRSNVCLRMEWECGWDGRWIFIFLTERKTIHSCTRIVALRRSGNNWCKKVCTLLYSRASKRSTQTNYYDKIWNPKVLLP